MDTLNPDDFPQRLHTAASMRLLERALVHSLGIDLYALMERAGAAVFARARAQWPEARRWMIVCGSGNNGGDGYVVARLARASGIEVMVVRAGAGGAREEAVAARTRWHQAGGVDQSLAQSLQGASPDLLIDAIFGIGLVRAPAAEAAAAIDWINAQTCPILSIDVPSGLNADTGATPGVCVRASMTLSLLAWKRGQFTGRARAVVGALQLDRLSAKGWHDPTIETADRLSTVRQMRLLLPPRARDAHKGDHGHVLVIGGDAGMGGAALLAAQSALRSGAGWVSLATRPCHVGPSLARCPEVMVRAVETGHDLAPMLARADVVLIGPGLGQNEWSRAMLQQALGCDKPLVLDADALNLVATDKMAMPANTIITPHPGEAARLAGTTVAEIELDRFAAVRALQSHSGGVVVLKGAGTLTADGAGVEVCNRGNPGMASAGMGDVLAGIIAALRGQKLSASDAARAGVWVHACAGDRAARRLGERGLIASDLITELAQVLNP